MEHSERKAKLQDKGFGGVWRFLWDWGLGDIYRKIGFQHISLLNARIAKNNTNIKCTLYKQHKKQLCLLTLTLNTGFFHPQ